MTGLATDRLLLRGWLPWDREPLAALNAEPVVMEHFPAILSGTQSNLLADHIQAQLRLRGWGMWAVEVKASGRFAGFVGLNPVTFRAPFTPAVEVGWRLSRDNRGHDCATEAARAAAAYGFDELRLPEIVSFTSATNHRSQRVMQRLGMQRDPAEDFDHPDLPPGHPLCRHVLYRLARLPPGASSAPTGAARARARGLGPRSDRVQRAGLPRGRAGAPAPWGISEPSMPDPQWRRHLESRRGGALRKGRSGAPPNLAARHSAPWPRGRLRACWGCKLAPWKLVTRRSSTVPASMP
ncbi:MAG: GNAT family protein [Candidatus Dormibacteria bacterium]